MNISENATSVRPEVKDVATVLQQVKTTIQQRYPYTVVNLKVERKGVKTTITAYGIGMDKAVEAYVDTHDLLTKNGFAVYPLTKPLYNRRHMPNDNDNYRVKMSWLWPFDRQRRI